MLQTAQTAKGSIWSYFDYRKMAEEARREMDRLHAILKRRLAEGPESPDKVREWEQGNRGYYAMYLEQRMNVRIFERRAEERRLYAA